MLHIRHHKTSGRALAVPGIRNGNRRLAKALSAIILRFVMIASQGVNVFKSVDRPVLFGRGGRLEKPTSSPLVASNCHECLQALELFTLAKHLDDVIAELRAERIMATRRNDNRRSTARGKAI
ncbi:hypothetical protein SPHINGO391_350356 [Sphingomonas aurantiaca]|uniref:Uncharacterized protein n=1 Tax=Sphingomonas aurantiaca TaxID=185949 RepID=A0A5E7Y9H7_9SPHN|nr:hypothetical protein SPHINGO391_350356 [Sphingomonas aurantiaca]